MAKFKKSEILKMGMDTNGGEGVPLIKWANGPVPGLALALYPEGFSKYANVDEAAKIFEYFKRCRKLLMNTSEAPVVSETLRKQRQALELAIRNFKKSHAPLGYLKAEEINSPRASVLENPVNDKVRHCLLNYPKHYASRWDVLARMLFGRDGLSQWASSGQLVEIYGTPPSAESTMRYDDLYADIHDYQQDINERGGGPDAERGLRHAEFELLKRQHRAKHIDEYVFESSGQSDEEILKKVAAENIESYPILCIPENLKLTPVWKSAVLEAAEILLKAIENQTKLAMGANDLACQGYLRTRSHWSNLYISLCEIKNRFM